MQLILGKTQIRFLLTGVLVNTALFAVLALLLHFNMDYRFAVTITYILGMVWGFLQNKFWSWESRAPVIRSFARYILVYAIIYVVHLILVMILVNSVAIQPFFSAIISAVALIIPIFVLLDLFVFAKAKP